MEESQKVSKKLLLLNSMLGIGIIVVAFQIYETSVVPVQVEMEPEVVVSKVAFDTVVIEAKSAYVLDLAQNKVLYKKNELAQLPLASLTKLMTALVAVEMFPRESHITIRKEFLEEEGDTGLLPDESWRLRNLLDFSLISSSNDGARSIASAVGAFDLKTEDYDLGRKGFIEKMNTRAKELGMQESYFINESGLDVGGTSGGYGSAVDVAKLLKYILVQQPALLEATKYKTTVVDSFDKSHTIKNTNTIIESIPGLIASKTGYTDLAGGNLAVAFDASIGRPIIVVVLGSSEKGRFEDVQKLVDASLKYIAN